MRVGIYLGVFDPITLGNLDIIKRSANLVDELIVGVSAATKVPSDFSIEERVNMVKKATKDLANVRIEMCVESMEQFARKNGATVLIRGLRMMTDFENELHIVQMNYQMDQSLDTIFLTTSERYSNFSSRQVREIAKQHGEITEFLPPEIIDDVKRIYI